MEAMDICTMDNNEQPPASLDSLPPELLIKIILFLDFHSVLRLQLVNTEFNDIIKDYPAVQYHIELGVAGMVDGPSFPHAPFTTAERLRRLQLYQSRWKHLTHTRKQTVRHAGGRIWELAQGVLAQGISMPGEIAEVRKIFFTRLPSSARAESRTREWSHDGYDFAVRDFTMDPSQDLLVLVRASSRYGAEAEAESDAGNKCQLEFRSLSTNKKHPKAKLESLVHTLDGGTRQYSHGMQICQDLFAILHSAHAGTWPEKIVVYNWKNGKLIFEISFCSIMSFTFITPNHLLFAVQSFNVVPAREGDQQPRFLICDIVKTAVLSPDGRPKSYAAIAEFHLPEMKQYTEVLEILLRSDPAPAPIYPDEEDSAGIHPPAAFSTAPENRLFAIDFHVATVPEDTGDHRASEFLNLCIFVPLSTLLPFLSSAQVELIPINSNADGPVSPFNPPSLPPRSIAVRWEDWMHHGTRALLVPGAENVWVCNVYGARFVSALEGKDLNAMRARRHVVVLDFNKAALRRAVAFSSTSESEGGSVDGVGRGGRSAEEDKDKDKDKKVLPDIKHYTEPSTLDATKCGIFEEDVTTCLPYRRTVLREKVRFDGVMLTEDNIIFVNKRAPKEYEVLTF